MRLPPLKAYNYSMIETSIIITYEGKDISRDIAPMLLSFSYTDNSGGNADDLNISLEDRKSVWLSSWTPSKGDLIKAAIKSGKNILPCGAFEVDQLEYTAPPKVLSLKAISAPVKGSLTSEKHNRAWEAVKLSRIAQDIAQSSGLGLYFDAEEDYYFERKEQNSQSDLEFLNALCQDYGLSVKIDAERIIIHDRRDEKAATSIIRSDEVLSWKFTSKSAGIYKGARVKYHHAKKAETFTAEIEDASTEGTGKILEISGRVESPGQARALALKKLRELNAKEITGNIRLAGDINLSAGLCVSCEGFGLFSGKYLISKATHEITRSGYTTEINIEMGQTEKAASKARKKKKQTQPQELYYTGENYYRAQ